MLWNRHFCCDAVVVVEGVEAAAVEQKQKKKTYLGRKKQIEISTKVRAADVVGANAAVRLNRLTIQSAATRYVKEFFRRFRVRGKASAPSPGTPPLPAHQPASLYTIYPYI